MNYGYIVECKLNEMDSEQQELQKRRVALLDEAARIEMRMRKLTLEKEMIKREYVKDSEAT